MIIPIHYNPSAEVADLQTVLSEAEKMMAFLDSKERHIFALHHSQVTEKPLNFFVISSGESYDWISESLGSRIIINPRVTGGEGPMYMYEGCASFPHRTPKNVLRNTIVQVEFDIPGPDGKFEHKAMMVARIIAQIFQHECDHANGKNIYFKSPKQ